MIVSKKKNGRIVLRLVVITFLTAFSFVCTAQFAGGQGTQGDPWQVSRAEHLNEVRNHLAGYFIQTADIDLDLFPWNEGLGWEPLGTAGNTFLGHYDGGGHIVSNLFINRPAIDYIGLFGHTSTGASIRNLGVTDINITGRSFVGGLLGRNLSQAKVYNCFSTGSVTGTGERIGGLVGYNQNGGSNIYDSYSRAAVNANNQGGGLVGHNRNGAGIENSYSTGRVTGNQALGGLTGFNQDGAPVQNSYWDIETSGQEQSASGEGRMTRQMTYPYDDPITVYIDWDFEELWVHDENGANEGYPALYYQQLEPPVVLDTPQVTVDVITIEEAEHIRVRWELVEDALSYKIFASEYPFNEDWGDPVAIVGEDVTLFTRPLAEADKKFFYVIASIEEVP